MNFQLADIRGKNKKYTLLKFLILQLQQSNPDALNFPDELKSVTKAAACKKLKKEKQMRSFYRLKKTLNIKKL